MNNATELMGEIVDKIKQMVDVNTVIGNPIVTGDGTTLIPITKVSIGIGSGGSDFKGKNQSSTESPSFGGGGGAGISIAPIAFVVVANGSAKILPVNAPASNTADRIVEMVPDAISKINEMFNKKDAKEENQN